jgi:hypothetical protein
MYWRSQFLTKSTHYGSKINSMKRQRRKISLAPPQPPPRPTGLAPLERLQIDYMFRDPAGQVHHRVRDWHRPATPEAIDDWMTDYFEKLSDGYHPEGFSAPPIPHCARITRRGRVVAEWMLTPQ